MFSFPSRLIRSRRCIPWPVVAYPTERTRGFFAKLWYDRGVNIFSLSELLAESEQLPVEEFHSKFSAPFLLHEEKESIIDYQSTKTMNIAYMPTQVEPKEASNWTVYQVCKSGGIPSTAISLGRAQDNDIILTDPSISKLHSYLTVRPGQGSVQVTDVGSKNGTFFLGQRVEAQSSVELKSGGVITFGRISLRYISVSELLLYLKSLVDEGKL